MPPRPADWREVIDALLALGEDRPVTVAIDGFPYLVKANPELPSVIQAALGPRREERLRSRTRLLLCGSAMSFMGRLLSGTAPLRGRAGPDRWVAENVLSRFSPLFREARYLLAEEPDIRDNAVYHSVLSAATWSARPPTSPTTCRSSKTPACSPGRSMSSAPAAASTGSASR
jgi:hypothetical protein